MNGLAVALVWCVVQVTLMSFMVGGVYLVIRRLRPAAAATIVFAGLTMIVLLTLAAFSPWPRWTFEKLFQSVDKSTIAAGASIDDLGERNLSDPGADRLKSSTGTDLTEAKNETADAKSDSTKPVEATESRSERASTSTSLATEAESSAKAKEKGSLGVNTKRFLRSIVEEISQPQGAISTAGWRWPQVVAVALVTAMICGLLWLLIGVVAVRRQSLRSRPVHDEAILELVDVLRAELSCRRPVEVRQSDELVTAATVGWSRPVLLLPSDWTHWTPDQCRAVLAHEIAHARSNDFLALLFGQLGLMLHFYHPAMHWLTNRLRLEQELAADAAAASVSGGQRQYLTTIAELALSRQDRPLLWPARTFLPTRNTFLRRIAMLRDSKLRFDRLSPFARLLAVGVIVLGGLFVAGLRGPAGTALAGDPPPSTVIGAVEKEATGAAEQENILANSGMEDGEEYAEHWIQGNSIEGVKYSWDKTAAFKGKASLCIEKSVNRYFPIAGWSQTVERKGDAPFVEVSAYVKTKKMFKAILDVSFLDKNDMPLSHEWAAYIGDKTGSNAPATHDWKKYAGTVKIPDGAAKILVELQDYGPGKVWFDEVQARYVESKNAIPAKEVSQKQPAAATEKPRDKDEAYKLTQEGWQLWKNRQMGEAIEKFKLSLEIDPKDAGTWNGLGWASFQSGKYQEAENAFLEVLRLNPNHPAALNGLGQLYFARKNYDQAEEYLLKAAPQAPAAWWGLARLYLLQGNFDEAENWARKIVESGEANDEAKQILQAAQEKHLGSELRSLIEPRGEVADKTPVAPNESAKPKSSQPSGRKETLSFVGESSEDKLSYADSGFAVLFERPAELKSISGVKLYGSRYGSPRPPNEKFHIYLLDENQKVLEHILVPYGKVQRGDMKWFTFEFPAIEVPEKFFVALWFDAESTKGVYVGKDANIEKSHSWVGLPDKGYHPVEENYDWMIRAMVSDDDGKKPTRPKVKTYEDENANDAELAEISTKRMWNDSTGAFSLEAEFVDLKEGKVSLKKTNGETISVALDRLSKEDQEFVGKQLEAKKSAPDDKSQELSHDDGAMASKSSINGGGHAVRFEVEGDSYYVTSVSLHGSRYGEPRAPQENFKVWICDEHFKPIATFGFPYGSYARSAPAWKSFKVKPTKVPKKFIVCFGFNPHQTKGVYVSYDAEGTGNSLIGIPGQDEPHEFAKGDWLIRCKVENRAEKPEK